MCILLVRRYGVAAFLGLLIPEATQLGAPVGLLSEDRDLGWLGREGVEQVEGRDRKTGRFGERREEILEALLVDLLQREGDADVGNLILLRDRRCRRMEIAAKTAEICDDVIAGEQGLEALHGLGRIGLVVESDQLQGHLRSTHRDTTGLVDRLDRQFIAIFNLLATRGIPTGQRDHRADLDGLPARCVRPAGRSRSRARTGSWLARSGARRATGGQHQNNTHDRQPEGRNAEQASGCPIHLLPFLNKRSVHRYPYYTSHGSPDEGKQYVVASVTILTLQGDLASHTHHSGTEDTEARVPFSLLRALCGSVVKATLVGMLICAKSACGG